MVYLIYALIAVGIAFNGLGSLALLRFPDVYTRIHGATKCTTFGSIFLSLGVIAYGFWQGGAEYNTLALHALVALIALLITNPTGSHAIARAAHKSGIKPEQAVVDDLATTEDSSTSTAEKRKEE
ncbi:MAG: monovalent cation/H(+) antiporter subunit G [Candidatus Bipolaricaulota bacterium]